MKAVNTAMCRKNERFPAYSTFHSLQESQGFTRIPGFVLQALLQSDAGGDFQRSDRTEYNCLREFSNFPAESS